MACGSPQVQRPSCHSRAQQLPRQLRRRNVTALLRACLRPRRHSRCFRLRKSCSASWPHVFKHSRGNVHQVQMHTQNVTAISPNVSCTLNALGTGHRTHTVRPPPASCTTSARSQRRPPSSQLCSSATAGEKRVRKEPPAQKNSHHNWRSRGPPSNSCTDVSTHVRPDPPKNDALITGPCSFQGRAKGHRVWTLFLSAAAPRTNPRHTLLVVRSRGAPGKQALGRDSGSLQGFGWQLRAKPRGEGHTSARRREGGQGGHLFF